MSSSITDLALLGQLLEQHRPRLLAMVQRRMDRAVAARVDAEDVLAEAFLQARRRWHRFREGSSLTPYAWLYRIVLDCLIEAWRRETRACRDARRAMPWPDDSSVQLGLGLVGPGTSPSEAVAREELCGRVRQTMKLLREADRGILWMRHYDQLSFPEAALVLGISERGATARYVRALRRLKQLWEHLGLPGRPGS